jgi:hypothetical protein
MGWTFISAGEDKCVQDFGTEISSKLAIQEADEMEENIRMVVGETGCEDRI